MEGPNGGTWSYWRSQRRDLILWKGGTFGRSQRRDLWKIPKEGPLEGPKGGTFRRSQRRDLWKDAVKPVCEKRVFARNSTLRQLHFRIHSNLKEFYFWFVFQTEMNTTVMTVFLLLVWTTNGILFVVHNQEKNCHYDRIYSNLKKNRKCIYLTKTAAVALHTKLHFCFGLKIELWSGACVYNISFDFFGTKLNSVCFQIKRNIKNPFRLSFNSTRNRNKLMMNHWRREINFWIISSRNKFGL